MTYVLWGMIAFMVIGGIVMILLMRGVLPGPCCKCGKMGKVTEDSCSLFRNRWWCFDHMGEP